MVRMRSPVQSRSTAPSYTPPTGRFAYKKNLAGGRGEESGSHVERGTLPPDPGDEDAAGHQEGQGRHGLAGEVGLQVQEVLCEELLQRIRIIPHDVLMDDEGELLLEAGEGVALGGRSVVADLGERVVHRPACHRHEPGRELDVQEPLLGLARQAKDALLGRVSVDEVVGARLLDGLHDLPPIFEVVAHLLVGVLRISVVREQCPKAGDERIGVRSLGLHRVSSSLGSEPEKAITNKSHCQAFTTKKPSKIEGFFVVGGEGFEPSKAQGQQIYSLSRLTASVSTHVLWPQPTRRAEVWQGRHSRTLVGIWYT